MTLEINTAVFVAYLCILIGGFLVGLGFKYVNKGGDVIGLIYAFGLGGVLTIVGVFGLLIEMEIVIFV